MNQMHRQDFDIQLETDFGTLHETNVQITSSSDRSMMGTQDQANLVMGMRRLFENNGVKLVGVAMKETIVTKLIEPSDTHNRRATDYKKVVTN